MFGELHLGEVAFADGLEQLVFSDVRLVRGPTPRGRYSPGGRGALAPLKSKKIKITTNITQNDGRDVCSRNTWIVLELKTWVL